VSLIRWARKRHVPHLIRTAGDDVISSRDGSIGMRQEEFVARLIAKELPRAQAVVALSGSIAEELAAMGLAKNAIHEIPNAVDITRFQMDFSQERRAVLRREFGLEPDAFLFLAVGRNHPQKNYPALLEAAARLARSGMNFQILVLGRDTDALETLAREQGLQGKLFGREIRANSPAGSCPQFPTVELIEAYRIADAFVMPSLLEGFSTALLEAMAAGLPVITTDAPGCKDFVRGGEDALMIPAGDAGALAEAMMQIMQDDALRSQLIAKSRARAEEFSWESVVDRYLNLYLSLLEK
jgi:glycosyltransferase involved in cell wall biosynthesis